MQAPTSRWTTKHDCSGIAALVLHRGEACPLTGWTAAAAADSNTPYSCRSKQGRPCRNYCGCCSTCNAPPNALRSSELVGQVRQGTCPTASKLLLGADRTPKPTSEGSAVCSRQDRVCPAGHYQDLLLRNPPWSSTPAAPQVVRAVGTAEPTALPHHDFSQRRLPPPLGALSSVCSVIPTYKISRWSRL